MMTKPNPEYEQFSNAMDAILRADPAKVKAQMEAEKKEPRGAAEGKEKGERR